MKLMDRIPNVYPSGVARATAFKAIVPIAPGRFSTTTGWPSAATSRSPTMRATTSGGEPAGEEQITRIGLFGYPDGAGLAAAATEPISTRREPMARERWHAVFTIPPDLSGSSGDSSKPRPSDRRKIE